MKLTPKLLILYFWSMQFPAGIWVGLEGYEIFAFCLLCIGFAPTALAIAFYLTKIGDQDA